MTDYTITTNFGAKDSLPSGNAGKVIKGSEFTTEFTNIQTAVNTKADTAGDTFTGVVNFSADVAVNTNTLFVDVSADKVGIGTTSPAQALDVVGNINIQGTVPTLLFTDTDSNPDFNIIAGGSLSFRDETNSATRMLIDSSGNVGIGTTSPDTLLHVYGAGSGSGTYGAQITIGKSNGCKISSTQESADDDVQGLAFFTKASNQLSDSAVERLRIDESGNVGIGTTSPNESLVVKGGIYAANQSGGMALQMGDTSGSHWQSSFKIKSDGSGNVRTAIDASTGAIGGQSQEVISINSAGNVGIGTSSPSGKTHSVAANNQVAVMADGDVSDPLYPAFGFDGQIGSNGGRGAGMYLPSDGTLAWSTVGEERMRIDSSGNVGIGTTSPQSDGNTTNLEVSSASGARVLVNNTDTSGRKYGIYSDNSGRFGFADYTADVTRMLIDSSGKVGIGTSSPVGDLTIGRNGNASGGNIMLGSATNATNKYGVITSQSYNSTTDTEGFAAIATQGISGTNLVAIGGGIGEVDSATQVRLYTSSATGTRTGTERMRIDSSGNVLVGTTDQYAFNGGFTVQTDTVDYINVGHASSVASGNYYAAFRHGTNTLGTITQNGTTGILYNTSSDERLKENITDSADAGSKVDAIQIRQFDWKADGSHQDYGVIAQELATVAPEAVHQPEDSEDMMGVDYSKLVPMLIKEVQSLRSRVAELENV